jgi:hypothetical protein
MAQNLKYLNRYKESKTAVTFYLKDLISVKAGILIIARLVQSLYEYLYDRPVELSNICRISELAYEVKK